MIVIRSIIFNVLFYMMFIAEMIIFTPIYFILPRKKAYFVPKFWARSNLWLMRVVLGTRVRIEGLENLPKGAFIFAPKHQTFWDTFAFLPHIEDPLYILKRELLWIPVFGWYVAKQRMIGIDRSARGKAMAEVMTRTLKEMKTGRQLIIYPEGTRRPPGAEPVYKYGIARLYRDLQMPVVPVVHQAGIFWPRRKALRQGGVIIARILPPIQPGMEEKEFFEHLVKTMEEASDKCLLDTVDANPHLILPETAKKRIAELRAQS
ncbi:lysophospholipid acyltransferase family protein [Rhizobium sp. C1]|uniref:lysophospholipid acyltransferase family protein n=1 Tax=Rhizobium sp. C1 TaxID=1349799 RepID=UPI001E318800|nr:1-acyl-sn-glycerol-3-phosphate acyltransferase [Rhizobium sp. C1]MCD2178383.1 1-acyl-sn-glycerol-3-phosphate acyltransferase [Rhizobium sp. C1]